MTRHVFIFLGTFLLGALVALGARTARHTPPADHAAPGPTAAAPTTAQASTSASAHSTHSADSAAAAAPAVAAQSSIVNRESKVPVNTLCAICGMDVDPKLPTATYQGKTIGFGCRMCLPKFAADPEKYGPLYLRNEVVTR